MDLNIGMADNLANIIQRTLIMVTTARALTILGLGVLTFKFLDLFLETNIIVARKTLNPKKMRALLWSLCLLGITFGPVVIIFIRLINGGDISSMISFIVISVIGCIIFGIPLKMCLPAGDPRRNQWVLIGDAVSIAIEVIAENIAYWLQSLIVKAINMVLQVVRAPFISYYLLVGTLLNLMLSFSITGFMGSSQMAGEVNIIGSLIGGAAHAIVRRERIAELKKQIEEENKTNENKII